MSERPDSDDLSDGLSPKAQAWFEKVDLRNHKVNLERVQRIHFGLDSEPMTFNATTVAQMVQDVADNNCDEDGAFTLHAVVRALLGKDDHHVLSLTQRQPGKFVSPDRYQEKGIQEMMALTWLARLETAGVKTEAAVNEIAAKSGVSRATVFARVKAAEEYLMHGKTVFPGSTEFENPRPSKSGKA